MTLNDMGREMLIFSLCNLVSLFRVLSEFLEMWSKIGKRLSFMEFQLKLIIINCYIYILLGTIPVKIIWHWSPFSSVKECVIYSLLGLS